MISSDAFKVNFTVIYVQAITIKESSQVIANFKIKNILFNVKFKKTFRDNSLRVYGEVKP